MAKITSLPLAPTAPPLTLQLFLTEHHVSKRGVCIHIHLGGSGGRRSLWAATTCPQSKQGEKENVKKEEQGEGGNANGMFKVRLDAKLAPVAKQAAQTNAPVISKTHTPDLVLDCQTFGNEKKPTNIKPCAAAPHGGIHLPLFQLYAL